MVSAALGGNIRDSYKLKSIEIALKCASNSSALLLRKDSRISDFPFPQAVLKINTVSIFGFPDKIVLLLLPRYFNVGLCIVLPTVLLL